MWYLVTYCFECQYSHHRILHWCIARLLLWAGGTSCVSEYELAVSTAGMALHKMREWYIQYLLRSCTILPTQGTKALHVISSVLPNAIVYSTHHCRVRVVHSSGRCGAHRHWRKGLLASKVVFILCAPPSTSVSSKRRQYRRSAPLLRLASRLDAPGSHEFPLGCFFTLWTGVG